MSNCWSILCGRHSLASRFFHTVLFLTILALSTAAGLGGTKGKNGDHLWTQVDESTATIRGPRSIAPENYLVYRVNSAELKRILASAPLEFTAAARARQIIFEVPTPDGRLERFWLEESPVLAPSVAAQFPTWKTFSGQGIDDPTATARFDINISGFHGYVSGINGTYLIDPYSSNDRNHYIAYYKGSVTATDPFSCGVDGSSIDAPYPVSGRAPEYSNGENLRTLRIAFSATKEYTTFHGNSTTTAFAAITTTVNRMILIYRRELAVTFTIVSNLTTVFSVGNDGGFPDASNPNVADLSVTRNQIVLDGAYGDANYDIGHALSRTGNPNGLALSPSLCSTGSKAQGFTGAPVPQGDGYDVDYVAHEIGHQFGMSHTFNNNVDGSCTTRSANSAYEPASGVTIMGYGGICAPRNLSANSIDVFHARSLEQSLAEMGTNPPSPGGTCGTTAATANVPPVPNAGANFTIPRLTPFTLTGSATDATNNGLTYSWEEYDLGNPTGSTSDPDTDANGARPIFRSYNPSTSPSRTFPSMTYILNNANNPPATYTTMLPNAPTSGSTNGYNCAAGENCITGESLPSIARTMNFRLTVRDNFAAGGGVADATMQVTVAATGPFRVTSPNTNVTYAGNSTQTVTWDVGGSSGAPVNAANVKISFSSDGGSTFPNVLLANTANDGSETVTIPNVATTTARIKVEAVGNIFFDISDVNFTTTASAAPVRSRADFDGDGRTDLSVFRPAEGNWYLNRSTAGLSTQHFGSTGDVPVPGDFDNDGKTDLAVFRPANDPLEVDFYVLQSATSTFTSASWGLPADIPQTGDYDGDGRTDYAVYRPSNNFWYVLKSTGGFLADQFGTAGDIPIAMDYEGDAKTNYAVFRPNEGVWYIAKPTGVPAQNFDAIPFGTAGDLPVAADYDNDNKDDVAVFRPGTGIWYVLRSTNGGVTSTPFGQTGDIPVPGDYDGDGADDVAVFRDGSWHLNRSTAGLVQSQFGVATDIPIPAKYLP